MSIVLSKEPDDEVALAINITNMCQALSALPRAGGLFDQDSYVIYLMQQVLVAQAERAELDYKKSQA